MAIYKPHSSSHRSTLQIPHTDTSPHYNLHEKSATRMAEAMFDRAARSGMVLHVCAKRIAGDMGHGLNIGLLVAGGLLFEIAIFVVLPFDVCISLPVSRYLYPITPGSRSPDVGRLSEDGGRDL